MSAENGLVDQLEDDDLATFFENIREELRNWPYTIHQIDDTLDSSLIEGRAKQILFQAINSRNLTAFVGSGLSAAYGRMTWREWQDYQLEVVDETANAFLEVAKAATELLSANIRIIAPEEAQRSPIEASKIDDVEINQVDIKRLRGMLDEALDPKDWQRRNVWRWLRTRLRHVRYAEGEIGKLHNTLMLAKSDPQNFPGGEALPVLFEIAQQLHELLRRYGGLFHLRGEPAVEQCQLEDFEGDCSFLGARAAPENAAPDKSLFEVKKKLAASFKDDIKYPKFAEKFRAKLADYHRVADRRETALSFAELVKVLLVDECAHAEQILLKAMRRHPDMGRELQTFDPEIPKLRETLDVITTDVLKREVAGLRQEPERYKVLTPFRSNEVVKLCEKIIEQSSGVSEDWRNCFGSVKEAIGSTVEASNGGETFYLTPSSRFLVGTALALLTDPLDVFRYDENSKEADGKIDLTKAPEPGDFRSRATVIDPILDPLAKAVRNLGINRFLTTNYDFEIERYYQDLGYRRAEYREPAPGTATGWGVEQVLGRRSMRVDGLGGALRDLAFDRETASDLISFTVGDEGVDSSVFHLHGRAERDEKIVVTERDYMDLYLRNDDARAMVDEGIEMAFSGAPVLFLGLGMKEADLLRPLRQFISDRDRSVGYSAIVLLPEQEGNEGRAKTAAALYMRYGVHTIFYGGGKVVCRVAQDGDEVLCEIDWLYRVLTLTSELKKIAEDELKWAKGDHTSPGKQFTDEELTHQLPSRKHDLQPDKLLERLCEKVGKLGPDLVDPSGGGFTSETNALAVLLGRKEMPSPEEIEGHEIKTCTFTPFRFASSVASGRNREAPELDGEAYNKAYTGLLTHLLRMTLRRPGGNTTRGAYIRDLQARITALDGLYGAFLTASLSAALDMVALEWRNWWKEWQQSPPHRVARFERIAAPEVDVEKAVLDDAKKEEFKNRGNFLMPRRFIRHRLHSVVTDLTRHDSFTAPEDVGKKDCSEAEAERDWRAAPDKTRIRAFDTFILAVRDQRERDAKKVVRVGKYNDEAKLDLGRRFYTIAALRGYGKGCFLSVLSTRLGLSSYVRAAWPAEGLPHAPGHAENMAAGVQPLEGCVVHPAFFGAIFINLSFSAEIASVYDMVVDALCEVKAMTDALRKQITQRGTRPGKARLIRTLEVALELSEVPKAELEDRIEIEKERDRAAGFDDTLVVSLLKDKSQLREDLVRVLSYLSRSERLETLLSRFAEASEGVTDALLGLPPGEGGKNWSLQPRILIALNAAELLFDETGAPKNMEIADILAFLSSDRAAELPLDLVFIGSESGVGGPWSQTRGEFGKPDEEQQAPPGRPSDVNEPNLAHCVINRPEIDDAGKVRVEARKLSSRIHFHEPRGELKSSQVDYVHFARSTDPTVLLVDNMPVLASALFLLDLSRDKRVKLEPQEEGTSLRDEIEAYRSDVESHWKKGFPPCPDKDIQRLWKKEVVGTLPGKILELNAKHKGPLERPRGVNREDWSEHLRYILISRYLADSKDDLAEWRTIRRTLGANRFTLTILLLAAERLVIDAPTLLEGAKRAERFIRETVDQIRNAGHDRREQVVLRAVLDCHRGFHTIGDPESDDELHQRLLRSLAVIGAPVSASVLVRLPEIRDYFRDLRIDPKISRRRQVARALYALSRRGLCFRLTPHPRMVQLADEENTGGEKQAEAVGEEPREDSSGWPVHLEFRYAVHRLVQRHLIDKLGSGSAEPIVENRFSPTLYASMPSDLPRLSQEAYQYLRALMIGLSQYPDIPHSDHGSEPWMFSTDNHATRVQALRAALSMVRSTFSIAVVSRFEDYRSLPGVANERAARGYFEAYKVQLRWIIRKAWELLHLKGWPETPDDSDKPDYRPDLAWRQVNALYRDEVVWLYNEVGLTCLVQGNLRDAVAMLRQAMEFNRDIEKREEGGRQHNHISLNLAVVQMERGRVESAKRRLASVRDSEQHLKGRIYFLAHGYLGLVEHLMGNPTAAKKNYEEATQYFADNGDVRAQAIFLKHEAHLIAWERPKEAQALLAKARGLAERAGHEDVRQHILVSEARIGRHSELADKLNPEQAVQRMKDVEAYAELLGVPALQCDAMHVRASILLEYGDPSSAAGLLVRTLAIARRNSMYLRLNRSMTTYAQTLIKRGRSEAARRLLHSSLDLAKRNAYNIEIARVRRVLEKTQAGVEI